MILKLFLIVLVLIALCFIGLAIAVIIKKNGKFPAIHISQSKAMRDRGIKCVNAMDADERNNYHSAEIREEKKY